MSCHSRKNLSELGGGGETASDPSRGPRLWRSLDELARTPQFEQMLHREFPTAASEWNDGASRRSFLKLMAANVVRSEFYVEAGIGGFQSQPIVQGGKFAERIIQKLSGAQPVLHCWISAGGTQHVVCRLGAAGRVFQFCQDGIVSAWFGLGACF